MKELEELFNIAKRKQIFDKTNQWSNGSQTYLKEIKKEIKEVQEELEFNRVCYLEEELGDVLWDYLNLLLNLKSERNINIKSILDRTCHKYDERISGIENGIEWNEIKIKQKELLENEQKKLTLTINNL